MLKPSGPNSRSRSFFTEPMIIFVSSATASSTSSFTAVVSVMSMCEQTRQARTGEQDTHPVPAQLSGGQRQRVGVARALAADPSVLLFDEPFGAVDPVTRLDLQKQFLALRRDIGKIGKTAIFVTHDVREALMLATRIALLRDGALELLATPRQFLDAGGDEARAFLACLDWKVDPQ